MPVEMIVTVPRFPVSLSKNKVSGLVAKTGGIPNCTTFTVSENRPFTLLKITVAFLSRVVGDIVFAVITIVEESLPLLGEIVNQLELDCPDQLMFVRS